MRRRGLRSALIVASVPALLSAAGCAEQQPSGTTEASPAYNAELSERAQYLGGEIMRLYAGDPSDDRPETRSIRGNVGGSTVSRVTLKSDGGPVRVVEVVKADVEFYERDSIVNMMHPSASVLRVVLSAKSCAAGRGCGPEQTVEYTNQNGIWSLRSDGPTTAASPGQLDQQADALFERLVNGEGGLYRDSDVDVAVSALLDAAA